MAGIKIDVCCGFSRATRNDSTDTGGSDCCAPAEAARQKVRANELPRAIRIRSFFPDSTHDVHASESTVSVSTNHALGSLAHGDLA
jgi:hypothetical protein